MVSPPVGQGRRDREFVELLKKHGAEE